MLNRRRLLLGGVAACVLASSRGEASFSQAALGYRPGPPLDTNGWTIFTDTDGTKIYVSTSGNDATAVNGDSTHPYQTLAAAVTAFNALTNNMPHRLLLKRGDTWTECPGTVLISGRSATEPMLISSYGSGNRPVIKILSGPTSGGPTGGWYFNANGDYAAMVGIDVYSYQNDPANGVPLLVTPKAIEHIGHNINWFLVEDCIFRFCVPYIEVTQKAVVTFRRNICMDSMDNAAYVDDTDSLLLEENFLDNCGWYAQQIGDNTAASRDQNAYCKTHYPMIARRNITSRASGTGLQQRYGGLCWDNLVIDCSVGIGFGDGDYYGAVVVSNFTVQYNVILGSVDSGGVAIGWGMSFSYCSNFSVQYNIIAYQVATRGNGVSFEFQTGCSGGTVTNNVIYKRDFDFSGTNAGGTTSPNTTDLTGGTIPDPGRSVGTYYASIGGTNSQQAFLDWHRARGPGVWDDRMGANAVNNYIRAGFGLAAVPPR
jgi:hypothetical protein